MIRKQTRFIIVVTAILVSVPQPAYAYIDPGTGSYVVQALIAAALGVSFFIKTYWNRIKLFFKKSNHQ